ncbi:MAG: 4-alpha-glucanotransferase [Planctomycetaceae bacterium]|jgi:4-alpha-glucanotransferase|nr:4-alpha-glucanotransferase [Planctomycetaceae bacterium]
MGHVATKDHMGFKQRISGVLMPLSSLPGSPLCGDLGVGARQFVAFLKRAGQKAWQMLPVNPIDDCFSPYASISTFAGDPIYIDLEDLVRSGLLQPSDLTGIPRGPKSHSAFYAARNVKMKLFHKAFAQFRQSRGTKYHDAFERFVDEAPWVGPHAAFCALSDHYGTDDWATWADEGVRHADQDALKHVFTAPELATSAAFHSFLQVVFDVQWNELRDYCRQHQIELIGDIPIYVSKNSVDTWANRRLFQLDSAGHMIRVAGVPADNFNPDGQRWNAPLYDWETHKADGYSWWLHRIGNALRRFDMLRLDHFIGFYNYFSMTPQPDENDLGAWIPGPADDFFEAVLREFPDAPLIAEDLGVMNPGVHQLRDKFEFPGINVFQFQFDFHRDTDATAEWRENSLVCTGTHDTNTLSAWFDDVLADRKKPEPFWNFSFLLGLIKQFIPSDCPVNRETVLWGIIRKVLSSPGKVSIFPMQDFLGLPSSTRMNFPGHADGNWVWRLDETLLTDELADRLNRWTNEFGR